MSDGMTVTGLKDIIVKSDSTSTAPSLSCAKMQVTGTNTICQYLAQHAGATHLLGSTPEEEAQITEWFSRCNLELSNVTSNSLQSINEALKSSTVLVGHRITLADISVFGSLFESVAQLKVEEKRGLVNLMRWFDYVQTVTGAKEVFGEHVAIEKKDFVPVPAPEATAADKGKENKGQPPTDKAGKGAKAPAPEAAKVPAPEAAKGDKKSGKVEAKAGEQIPAAAQAAPPAEKKEKGKEKAMKEPKAKEAEKAPAAKAEVTVSALDIRVGKIVKVWPHPGADGLWVEEIDLGEAKPRQVVSGLRKFVPEERMLGARVLVVANVKPGNLRDVRSEGLVLCASNADHTDVDFVLPPEGVSPGEKVAFPGYDGPPDEQLNSKKKQLETVLPFLMTDAEGIARYKDVPFSTSKGHCTARLTSSHIK